MNKNDFEKIKKGDRTAFNKLFYEYYEQLFNYAYTLLDNISIAEEIVLDVFTHLWIHRKKIHIKSNLKYYLIISVRNKIFNFWNSNKSKPKIVQQQDMIDNNNPETKLIWSDEQKKVNRILQLIPKKSREIFILHKFNNLKYKEIAELLHISVNTVENHISKALKILRQYYNKKL